MAPTARLNLWWGFWLATLLTWPGFWATVPWDECVNSRGNECNLDATGWAALILRLLVVPTATMTALYVDRLTALQRARFGEHAPEPAAPAADPKAKSAWLIAGAAVVAAVAAWGIDHPGRPHSG